jgi:hypothetical protein
MASMVEMAFTSSRLLTSINVPRFGLADFPSATYGRLPARASGFSSLMLS